VSVPYSVVVVEVNDDGPGVFNPDLLDQTRSRSRAEVADHRTIVVVTGGATENGLHICQ